MRCREILEVKRYDPPGSKAYDKIRDPGIYYLIRGTCIVKMGPFVIVCVIVRSTVSMRNMLMLGGLEACPPGNR